jgi:hypothetical protein
MADKDKPTQDQSEMIKNFQDMVPRSIFAEADPELMDKKGATFTGFTGGTGYGFNQMQLAGMGGMGSNNILRNPSRRFYDPEITTTAIYLPRNIRQKNRWCRWFFDHDEFVGAVLELHAELPYSRAEIVVDDTTIKRHIEECLDKTNFFSMLPAIDLEFMKIGEVFIHTPWDEAKGMWSHIIIHNPDFIEVRTTPFADSESVIELRPDDELRKIVHSTKPEDQQLKKRLPKEVVRRVLTGKNIMLDSREVTHIARRSNPYDIRGTSLLNRLFRLLMYEDKLREAQITIADNFIYPLKIFKLGDPQKGWIPDESHQRALAQMLQNANFDPNFSLIYHYGLQVEYMTVADKVMRLDKEWQEISEKKMIALGISKEMLTGGSTYAAANVGLQTQLARYKAKRDLFEVRWMMDKFFRVMAEKNEWYKRDAREILGHYRVKRTAEESRQRLIMPKMMWHKKLMMRDDQQFLTFLNNVYAQGKGPISAITMLMSMGLDTESELRNKSRQKEFEEMIGEYIQTPAAVGPATPGGGLGAMAKLKGKLKFGKQEKVAEEPVSKDIEDREFVGHADKGHKIADKSAALLYEEDSDNDLTNDIIPVNSDAWSKNISSPNVPSEVIFAMTAYDNKLRALQKKYNGGFKEGITENSKDLLKSLVDMYVQGKLTAYGWTNFLPIYRQHYAQGEDLRDYSDIVLSNEFEDWIVDLSKMAMETDKLYKHVRDLANTCYCYGQLKGFQEQGIYSVKVSNSESMDGLRYTVGELNKKGKNLSSIVSPMGEIVMFSPCIEGFDDEDFGNSIDSNIKRYKDSYVAGIQINNCPVEISPFLERYVNKFGKYLKKEYDNVVFVADVINLPAWEESQKRKIEAELKDIKDEVRQYVVINRLAQDKFSKVGKIPSYKQGRIMYISNWVGMEDTPITANLLKYLPITDDSLYKSVEKTFKVASNDLTKDEINTYKIFGYIQPLYDGNEEIMGWRAVEGINKVDGVDEKVVFGKNWDSAGRCASTYTREPRQLFEDNVRLWIDYPNKLSATVKAWFESL